jgi:hypothetical protein
VVDAVDINYQVCGERRDMCVRGGISIIKCAEEGEPCVVDAVDINYQVRGGRRDMCGRGGISIIKCAEGGEPCVVDAVDINYQVCRERGETCVVVVGYQLSSVRMEERHVWSW